jgi:hypothetical protein
MDSTEIISCTYKDRMLIHRCRLHLQVELLSDIVNDKGDCILEEWKNHSKKKSSRSHKRWPRQADPGKEAWRTWKTFLHKAYENSNGTLRQQLGSFIQSWIRLAERLIRTVKKQKQIKSNARRLMENNVKWQPPINKKKITASELQPD